MPSTLFRFATVLFLNSALLASAQSSQPKPAPPNGGDFSNATDPTAPLTKVPTGVILIKGAWSSASDSTTPLPEASTVTDGTLHNNYFGITYPLPSGWTQWHEGPPPSDTGRYVLAQFRPADASRGHTRGTILITAQDMFFNPQPAANALQLANYAKDTLQSDYKIEQPPTPTKIGGRPFIFLAYWSPAAQLHWYVLDTEIRCHTIEVVLTSRDTKLLENLVLEMDKVKLPAETSPTEGLGGGDAPVCIRDYARAENMVTRVDPVFQDSKFNAVPVRIIIDKKGAVKHIHFLSAFPDQAKAITDAMSQWRFKPYIRNGQPTEVETGIMFGRAARIGTRQQAGASVE